MVLFVLQKILLGSICLMLSKCAVISYFHILNVVTDLTEAIKHHKSKQTDNPIMLLKEKGHIYNNLQNKQTYNNPKSAI